MSGMNLNSFAENASRLGARLQETISEHTKELNLRVLSSSYFDLTEDKVKNIRKQLDSNSDREKLEGLKRLIALISKGRNVSDFFPAVIKNVASHNIEIRKLVYIYLLRHADTDPELALLSINTFQKDLKDPNPLIRSMALRVLSGINNPMIGNIVVLSIKQCAADISPYVRKTAALALIKCYNVDGNHLSSIIPILLSLLKDKSPLSIGAVALAFQSVCPTRLDLLHPHYRRLCRTLADVDEWGQVYMLELLTRYARSMLSKPSSKKEIEDGLEDIDLDLKLLLDSAKPLFMSRNPAVVLAVSRVFYYLAPSSQHSLIVNPVLRLLSNSKEVERVVLAYIFLISREEPVLFSSSYSRFLVRVSDIPVVKRLKIQVLLNLISGENYIAILREFLDYAEDTDQTLVSASIHAIGRCALLLPESSQQCLSALVSFIGNDSDAAVASAVLELKSLIRIGTIVNNNNQISTNTMPFGSNIIAALAARIDQVKHPSAKASVLWLVGQYATIFEEEQAAQSKSPEVVNWAPDTLRTVAKTFSSETAIVKLQALTLAAKLQCLSPQDQTISLLCLYIFSLARYDLDYDVRDRSRILSSLLAGFTKVNDLSYAGLNGVNGETNDRAGVVLRREQVILALFDGKSTIEDKVSEQSIGMIGSLDPILGKSVGLESGRRLPDWPDESTDSSLRDSEDDHMPSDFVADKAEIRAISNIATIRRLSSPVVLTPTGEQSPGGTDIKGTSGGRGQWINLDKFYDEESSEESSEEEEEEELDKPYEHHGNHFEEVFPDNDEEEEESEEENELKSIDSNQSMIFEKRM